MFWWIRLLLQTEREHADAVLRLLAVTGGRPRFGVSGDPRREWERLIVLVARGQAEEMLARAVELVEEDGGGDAGNAGVNDGVGKSHE